MDDNRKTKKQLVKELAEARRRLDDLENELQERHITCEPASLTANPFKQTFQKSLDIMIVVDTDDSRIMHVSDCCKYHLGYEPEKLIGKKFSALFPEAEEKSREELLEMIRVFDAVFSDQSFQKKDGSVTYLDVTSTLIPWNNNNAILVTLRSTEERREAEAVQEKLMSELQGALEKVKLLSGFLPICVHCKRIRSDEGFWQQVEEYIRDHSEAEFSHSICPDCMKEHYSDFRGEDK